MYCRLFLVSLAFLATACSMFREDRSYPLGPEMAQLEKDIASPAYRDMVRGMTNYNDLNGEILRIDIPDNARDFASRHSGLHISPELTAAYEKRKKIEEGFLELMRSCYVKINREGMFKDQLEHLFTDTGPGAVAKLALEKEVRLEPILPAPDAESHWPRWRGPWGQGHSRETEVPTSWSADTNIGWKTPLPGRGNSSPVIWGDRLFLTTSFDRGTRRSLMSLRRQDGEILWLVDAPHVEPEKRVRDKNGYASATPVVDGERVITFFGNTGLVAFDFEGKRLWHRPLGTFDALHGTGASPVLCGDLAILFQEQSGKKSRCIAVNKHDGEIVWEQQRPMALGWCTPLPLRIGDREEVIYGAKHTVVSYDPLTGTELWHCEGPTREVIPTMVYGHGMIYSCSGRNGPTMAIRPGGSGDISASRLVWKVRRGAPHVPSPILHGELLYMVNDTGILTCLEALTGKTVFQKRLGGKFSASPVSAAGIIYFTNESGDTFVIRAGREYELLGINSMNEGVLASMAILDGRIYLRTRAHLYAIENSSS